MKKTMSLFRLLALLALLLGTKAGYSQCGGGFSYTVNPGGYVTFASTATTATSFSQYAWNFGSSGTLTSSSPTAAVNYTANGNYTVTLNAIGSCTVNFTSVVSVTTVPCTVAANFTSTTGANGQVSFNGAISTGTTVGATYSWVFSNGATATGAFVQPTFTANATYVASLTVNNNSFPSCISVTSHTFVVNTVCNLVSNFVYSANNNGNVTFTSTSTGTVAGMSYSWSPSPLPSVASYTSGTNLTQASVNFTSNGTYTVYLNVSDNVNCSATHSAVISVTSVPCAVANFSYTQVGGGQINFNGTTSVGTTTNTVYSWLFSTGNTATGPFPSQTHTNNGTYTATLTISLPGCTVSASHPYTVTNACSLLANFSYTVNAGGNVSLLSTSTGTNASMSYSWSANPTGTPTYSYGLGVIQASATYTLNGLYTVYLSVSDGAGCSSSFSISINVTTVPCTVAGNFTYSPGPSGQLSFSNTSTGTNGSTTYSWISSAGSTASGYFASLTFPANGVYTVTLLVNNNTIPTCTTSVTHTVTVNNICTLVANFTYSVGSNGTVSFSSTSTGTVAGTSYTWSPTFSAVNAYTAGTGNTQLSVNYTTSGTYDMWLTLYNPSTGCSSSYSTSFSVTVPPPCNLLANFSYTQGANGHFTFSNTSTGTTTNTTYSWNFLYSSANGALASQTYTSNGIYTVTLTVLNSLTPSCSATSIKTITVTSVVPPCNSAFTYTAQGSYFQFTSISTNTTSSTVYNWNFGDQTTTLGISPVHGYTASGNYVVVLNLADPVNSLSCTSQQTIVITPTCNLTAGLAHTVGSTGIVSFSCTTTNFNPSTTVYHWNFGDGYINTGNQVSHAYSNAGTYYIKLILTNGTCSDSITQSINITGVGCNANSNFILAPSGIPQEWLALPSYPWNVVSASWSWGDGSTSDSLYTSHTYSAAASYSICLTVITSCGDTSTTCSNYLVNRAETTDGIIKVNVTQPSAMVTGILTTEANNLDYTIYPNPAGSEVNLKLNTPGIYKITVYTLVGAVVYEKQATTHTDTKINLDQLSGGVYFIRVSADNKVCTKRLIITK